MFTTSISSVSRAFVLVALAGMCAGANAQVPAKRPASDTLKKPAAGTIKKPGKAPDTTAVKSAAGDVLLQGEPMDRETQAREHQRLLDSVEMELRVAREVRIVRTQFAEMRERARLDSIARAEELARAVDLARRMHLARGWYLGVAGGASMPMREIRNGYTGGWNTTIPLGWDASDAPYGFRIDYSVDHLDGTRIEDQNGVTQAASGAITIWSMNTDVKLRAHAPGTPTRSHVYVLGGIGAHKVSDGVYGTNGANAGRSLSFGHAKTNFGWNVGAGAAIEWGPAEMFIESRFIQVRSNLDYHVNNGVGTYTSFAPLVIGLHWF